MVRSTEALATFVARRGPLATFVSGEGPLCLGFKPPGFGHCHEAVASQTETEMASMSPILRGADRQACGMEKVSETLHRLAEHF